MFAGKWIYGDDFGEVPDEYVEKTGGIKKWNLKMDYGMFHILAVLHENGIKVHAKSMIPGKVDFISKNLFQHQCLSFCPSIPTTKQNKTLRGGLNHLWKLS